MHSRGSSADSVGVPREGAQQAAIQSDKSREILRAKEALQDDRPSAEFKTFCAHFSTPKLLSGSSGSSDTDTNDARRCADPNTAGKTSNVATVAAINPPITARPSGAVSALPRPMPSAIGSIPVIIARLVISTGRKRSPAAFLAATLDS